MGAGQIMTLSVTLMRLNEAAVSKIGTAAEELFFDFTLSLSSCPESMADRKQYVSDICMRSVCGGLWVG